MALTKIASTAASSSSAIAFTSSINSTYKLYMFKFIELHPETLSSGFQVNFSTDGGSNYNVSKTTSTFRAYNTEDGSSSGLSYNASQDLGSSTAYQPLMNSVEDEADSNGSGYLYLYNPSNTTYFKHFSATCQYTQDATYSEVMFTGGFLETTSAINAINFKMASGNIDAGTIEMWGL